MKVGAENKFELWAAVVLGVLALASIGYFFKSSQPPTRVEKKAESKLAANRPLINPLDPTIRLDLLDAAQNVKYEGKGRNIFTREGTVEIPQPNKSPLTDNGKKTPPPPPPQPQGPPPPPPINLKFFGMASRAGEQPRIFLSEGDSVFVAREGDVVDSRYKVVKITPQAVEIEDLLNNNKQVISLSQG